MMIEPIKSAFKMPPTVPTEFGKKKVHNDFSGVLNEPILSRKTMDIFEFSEGKTIVVGTTYDGPTDIRERFFTLIDLTGKKVNTFVKATDSETNIPVIVGMEKGEGEWKKLDKLI